MPKTGVRVLSIVPVFLALFSLFSSHNTTPHTLIPRACLLLFLWFSFVFFTRTHTHICNCNRPLSCEWFDLRRAVIIHAVIHCCMGGLAIEEISAVLGSDSCWIAWFSAVWWEPRVPRTCWATGQSQEKLSWRLVAM